MKLLQGALPLDPGIYRFVSGGLATGIHFRTKKSDAVWRRPRKTGGRSGRIPALPYPPVTPAKATTGYPHFSWRDNSRKFDCP